MTKLQQRLNKIATQNPVHIIATEMGISPSTFMKMKNGRYVPKQKRVLKAVERYLKEKGV